jgi:hypothetical protein
MLLKLEFIALIYVMTQNLYIAKKLLLLKLPFTFLLCFFMGSRAKKQSQALFQYRQIDRTKKNNTSIIRSTTLVILTIHTLQVLPLYFFCFPFLQFPTIYYLLGSKFKK